MTWPQSVKIEESSKKAPGGITVSSGARARETEYYDHYKAQGVVLRSKYRTGTGYKQIRSG